MEINFATSTQLACTLPIMTTPSLDMDVQVVTTQSMVMEILLNRHGLRLANPVLLATIVLILPRPHKYVNLDGTCPTKDTLTVSK